MDPFREKFTIKRTDTGVVIIDEEGKRLQFSAAEALMLLDVLKNEKSELKKIAEGEAPLPFKIRS